jgi:hypothetical protein
MKAKRMVYLVAVAFSIFSGGAMAVRNALDAPYFDRNCQTQFDGEGYVQACDNGVYEYCQEIPRCVILDYFCVLPGTRYACW